MPASWRRLVIAALSVVALLVIGLILGPSAASATATHGKTVCTITDHRVIGLSGLIVTGTGFVAISDSNIDKNAIRIWFLDRRCDVTRSVSYPTSAYDPEDMALGRDGTIYVADIGDNHRERTSIAVWRLGPGSSTPKIYRYRYPDHPHDAEALLLSSHDTPIFVTKDIGVGEIYTPTAPANPSGKPVLLKQSGSFDLPDSTTPNGLGVFGPMLVTGGANSRDRSAVALRTYADAYVFPVPNGDVVHAITTGTPTKVPLPDEPQGESVAFDPSGTHLYTVSDRETQPIRTKITEYALPDPPRPQSSPSARSEVARTSAPRTPSYLLLGAAGLGILLVATGATAIFRHRRR